MLTWFRLTVGQAIHRNVLELIFVYFQPPPELAASSKGLREALRPYQKLDIDPRLNLCGTIWI